MYNNDYFLKEKKLGRIIRNAARCKLCGDVIESTYTHDYVTCSCGNLSVDGGYEYLRRGLREGKDSFEDLSEVVNDDE